MATLHIPLEDIVSALPKSYDGATICTVVRTVRKDRQPVIYVGNMLYIEDGYAMLNQNEEHYAYQKYERTK